MDGLPAEATLTKRDPRIDPMPGDVTKYPHGNTYTIQKIADGYVYFTSEEGDDRVGLDEWRELAVSDTVIKAVHS